MRETLEIAMHNFNFRQFNYFSVIKIIRLKSVPGLMKLVDLTEDNILLFIWCLARMDARSE